ncbi:MAG: DNA recombination protein RmuC [Actinomycetota bacterium]
MTVILMIVAVVMALAAAAAGFVYATRRAEQAAADHTDQQGAASESIQSAIDEAVGRAVAQAREQAADEREAAVAAALRSSVEMQREQLDATLAQQRELLAASMRQQQDRLSNASSQVKEQTSAELGAKKDVIDARLDQVHAEMRGELTKLAEMVTRLGESNTQKFSEVETSLRAHMEVTGSLSASTQALQTALANPQARGQWGERMAEDVLRLAGFVENVNYVKQTQIEGSTGRPDYTFQLPKGQLLFMDVKFPMAAYLRYLEAGTEAERQTHLTAFLRDVRTRVKELARREYAAAGSSTTVDNVLLFIPNEHLTGFIHEHDPGLLDDAMRQQVVMCSPLTLFAFLGVIRQAHDNFMVEQTSDEILQLLGKFGQQWTKYADQVEKLKRKFQGVEKDFDALTTTRRKALERPLRDLEDIRQRRGLPVDGELFALDTPDDDETPPGGNVRHLGA